MLRPEKRSFEDLYGSFKDIKFPRGNYVPNQTHSIAFSHGVHH